ncbi:MAG: ATP synthase F0 subunit B [Deltaproteobacteria bacterium]|nr:ATP synthase F0 subunit B [Deltaproteobacteria bacterium]
MQIVSNVALISINETMVVQLISFLIFLFVINRVMFRPLRESMHERERYIEGIRLDIRDAEKKLETIIEQTRDEDAAVRKAGLQMTAELEKRGNEEAGEIIAAARQEIVQIGGKARQDIDVRIAEARKTIVAEADKLSVNIMEKVLDRRLAS